MFQGNAHTIVDASIGGEYSQYSIAGVVGEIAWKSISLYNLDFYQEMERHVFDYVLSTW